MKWTIKRKGECQLKLLAKPVESARDRDVTVWFPHCLLHPSLHPSQPCLLLLPCPLQLISPTLDCRYLLLLDFLFYFP